MEFARAVLLVAVGAALCLAPPAPALAASGAIYGLVIGIDDYVGDSNDLDGAVNDARDIANALKLSGAKEVVTLLDGQATKSGIESNWFRLLGAAAPGDTLVFSFAGHGAQEPEPADRKHEADGLNENFLLAGFTPSGAGTAERIVDDEIFEWLTEADKKGVNVIFIADSCHSGGMSRSARADGVRFRNGNFDPITNDQLQFPPPAIAALTESDFELATFIAATSEDRLTPEVTIEGQKRGALSWAFARALEGRADRNGDGVTDQLELLSFLVPAVHGHVQSQQTPQVLPLQAATRALFAAPSGAAEPIVAPAAEDEAAKLQVLIEGDAPPQIAELPFVNVVTEKGAYDIVWTAETGIAEHVVGGVVAENVGADDLTPVLSKWAALKLLQSIATRDPAEASIVGGNQRHTKGEIVRVSIKGAKHPHMTLFNLPPDGRVEFFVPDPTRPSEASTDWRGKEFSEQFRIDKPPYGAEHMIAIFSAEPLTDLHAALRTMRQAQSAGALRSALEQLLAGKNVQVGVLDIYTGGAP